jgi:hypothetical protein
LAGVGYRHPSLVRLLSSGLRLRNTRSAWPTSQSHQQNSGNEQTNQLIFSCRHFLCSLFVGIFDIEISFTWFIPTKITRRINSTNIFTSKGDNFDNLVLISASFPPSCIGVGDGVGAQHHHKLITVP